MGVKRPGNALSGEIMLVFRCNIFRPPALTELYRPVRSSAVQAIVTEINGKFLEELQAGTNHDRYHFSRPDRGSVGLIGSGTGGGAWHALVRKHYVRNMRT